MRESLAPLLLLSFAFSLTGGLRSLLTQGLRRGRRSLESASKSIDVSLGRGLVLKRVLRAGDYRKGLPLPGDEVDLKWDIRLLNGSLVGSSCAYEEANSELFRVRVGAEPRAMIEGWELAVATMLEGEVAEVVVRSPAAFGGKGLAQLVPPDTDISCTLELVTLVPAPSRRFRSVGLNESISEELVERIQ